MVIEVPRLTLIEGAGARDHFLSPAPRRAPVIFTCLYKYYTCTTRYYTPTGAVRVCRGRDAAKFATYAFTLVIRCVFSVFFRYLRFIRMAK